MPACTILGGAVRHREAKRSVSNSSTGNVRLRNPPLPAVSPGAIDRRCELVGVVLAVVAGAPDEQGWNRVYAARSRESDVLKNTLATDPVLDLGSEPFGVLDQLPGCEDGTLVLRGTCQKPVVGSPELALSTGGLDRNGCDE
jgi:hypothetical protein